MEIFNAEANTAESEELDLLIVLVKDYDGKQYQLLKHKWEITLKKAQKLKNYFSIPTEVFLKGA